MSQLLKHIVTAFAGIIILGTLACDVPAQETDETDNKQRNAALQYWTAFALLDAANPNTFQVETNWLDGPITPEDRLELLKLDAAFQALHTATLIEDCDWEIDFTVGPTVALPHLSEARRMYRCAIYRARMHIEDGEPEDALQLITDVAALGRRLGKDAVMVCFLVDIVTEEVAIEFAAREFVRPGADAGLIQRLEDQWRRLPPGGSAAEAVALEAELFPIWFRAQSAEQMEQTKRLPMLSAILEALASATSFEKQVQPTYDALVEFAERPRELRIDIIKTLLRDELTMPGDKLLFDGVRAVIEADDRLAVKQAMLFAALDIVQNGPGVVSKHHDPVTIRDPFAYEQHEGGFTLRSALVPSRLGKPVEMTFGQSKD